MPTKSSETLKHIALLIAGLIAVWGMFVMGWCSIRSIYIDVPMLLVLSNIVTGIASSITTLLVGRTLAQLNQPADSDTTVRQTTEVVTTPKATLPGNLEVTKQPEVAVIQPEEHHEN